MCRCRQGRRFLRRWRRAHRDVRPHLGELRLGNTSDRQQVFDSAKTSGFRAELNDRFGGGGSDAGKLLKLLCGGGVDVDFVRRRVLCNERRCGNRYKEQSSTTHSNWRGRPSKPRRLSHTSSLPFASYSVTGPNRAACSPIWARSPTMTICALAESKWRRAAVSTSAAVSARIRSR